MLDDADLRTASTDLWIMFCQMDLNPRYRAWHLDDLAVKSQIMAPVRAVQRKNRQGGMGGDRSREGDEDEKKKKNKSKNKNTNNHKNKNKNKNKKQ